LSHSLIDQLTEAFRCLPGIGPKSAQRMVWHLLERDREGGKKLASTMVEAMQRVDHCQQCHNFSEDEICTICSSASRDDTLLCVVESPADVLAIEQSGSFRGKYFVTMGNLSPIDGIGPDEIGADALLTRSSQQVVEVILAMSSTVEGEATAHYLGELLKAGDVTVSRIAHGIPIGGELEYVDGGTLTHALQGRKTI
jgi:recombination protein RecR